MNEECTIMHIMLLKWNNIDVFKLTIFNVVM